MSGTSQERSQHPDPSVAGVGRIGRRRSRLGRTIIDRTIIGSLVGCAGFSVAVTGLILFVLLRESLHFFGDHSPIDFFFGTEWSPLLGAEQKFGVLPLVTGTLLVTTVSAFVSLPLGLVTAIFLSEYAPGWMRSLLKPILEILAGIPTIVYGFFAVTVITPVLQQIIPGVSAYNAASAGFTVGIMCLPIVTSLSEDALRAVPLSMREGGYALGGTKFDVSVRIVVPAALSGVVGAYLLALARAIGETMIVTLAAGSLAQLTLDPRDQIQTMTGYMVEISSGDASNLGTEYYARYAIALTLFLMTLVLTLLGGRVLKRFREVYE